MTAMVRWLEAPNVIFMGGEQRELIVMDLQKRQEIRSVSLRLLLSFVECLRIYKFELKY